MRVKTITHSYKSTPTFIKVLQALSSEKHLPGHKTSQTFPSDKHSKRSDIKFD